MDLKQALTHVSEQVHQELATFFSIQASQAQTIDDSVFHSVQMLEEFALRGGKSLRSFLTVIAYQLAGGKQSRDLYKAAGSVELHHKHILILDDIADRDETRYGGPTLHQRYLDIFGTSADGMHRSLSFAMLDGVFLGALSKELLLSTSYPAPTILDCIHLFNTVLYRDTLAGWQIHGLQAIKPFDQTTEEEFIKGLRLVTASYTFEGPLLMGLTLAQSQDPTLRSALQGYANHVGTAFQIHDDILGLFGDPIRTGKPVGNDVREGKKTLLLQYTYAHTTPQNKAFLEQVTGTPLSPEQLQTVQQIVRETGSLNHSNKLEQEFVAKGIEQLHTLPDSDEKTLLMELAHYIITRDK